MSIDAELIDRVLLLPLADRAALLRIILLSLEASGFDAEAASAWDTEIEARMIRFERGESRLLDWRESIRSARRNLPTRGVE